MAKKSVIEIHGGENIVLDDLTMVSATRRRVELIEVSSGVEVSITGEGLKISNGVIVGGTVDDVHVRNAVGEDLLTLSKLSINAAQIPDSGDMLTFLESLALNAILKDNKYLGHDGEDFLFGSLGDDLIKGRGGDDELAGQQGQDVLVGGGGADTFYFSPGMGRDVIRDFDAEEGDLIAALDFFGEEPSISRAGKDTKIDFGDGDIFLLRNASPEDVAFGSGFAI